MVRLKNIRIANGIAEADFYPEESTIGGHLVVDVAAYKIISCKEVPGYGESYKGHAKLHLIRMAEQNDTATERTVMWY